MTPTTSERTSFDEHSELVVLTLLLSGAAPQLWSIDELARELGDELRTVDAVASLSAAGLVYRREELVFATRAAARFSHLLGGI
jgi:hypothetical protein